MIAPLLFSLNGNNATPHSITEPMFCGHCKKSRSKTRNAAVLYCKRCSKMSNKQYLCRECDVKVHAQSNRKKHSRNLICLGSGLIKNTLYAPTHEDIPVSFLDHVTVRVSSTAMHSNKQIKEPPMCLRFNAGTSGQSFHMQLTSIETDAPYSNYIYFTVQYSNKLICTTRRIFTDGRSLCQIYNESVIIPIVLKQDINTVLRMQMYEIVPYQSYHTCVGQLTTTAYSILSGLKSNDISLPILFDTPRYIGQVSYDIGFSAKCTCIRVASFISYLQSMTPLRNIYYKVSYLNSVSKLLLNASIYLSIPNKVIIPYVLEAIKRSEHSNTLYTIDIYHGRKLLGKVDIDIELFIKILKTEMQNNANLESVKQQWGSVLTSVETILPRDVREEKYSLLKEELRDLYIEDYTAVADYIDRKCSSGSRSQSGSRGGSGRSSSRGISASASAFGSVDNIENKSHIKLTRSSSFQQRLLFNDNEGEEETIKSTTKTSSFFRFCTPVIYWCATSTSLVLFETVPPELFKLSSSACKLMVSGVFSDKGEVVRGLDLGVRSMRLGEVAEIKCRYDFVYGSNAVGVAIPPRTNIIFNIELLRINDKATYPYPIRVMQHRLQDIASAIKEISSEVQYDEEVLAALKDKNCLHVAFYKGFYYIKVKLETFLGARRKHKALPGDIFIDDDEQEEEAYTNVEGHDVSEEEDSSEDDDEAVDRGVRIGASFMWRKDRKLIESKYKKI